MKSIYLILLILLAGCTALKKNAISDTTNDISSSTESKIIFLNYRVTKGLDKTIKIDLINKVITEGNLKKNIQKTTNNVDLFLKNALSTIWFSNTNPGKA